MVNIGRIVGKNVSHHSYRPDTRWYCYFVATASITRTRSSTLTHNLERRSRKIYDLRLSASKDDATVCGKTGCHSFSLLFCWRSSATDDTRELYPKSNAIFILAPPSSIFIHSSAINNGMIETDQSYFHC